MIQACEAGRGRVSGRAELHVKPISLPKFGWSLIVLKPIVHYVKLLPKSLLKS